MTFLMTFANMWSNKIKVLPVSVENTLGKLPGWKKIHLRETACGKLSFLLKIYRKVHSKP